MKPLYPATFTAADVARQHWAEIPANIQFYRHVRNVCNSFPSVVLARSARPGLESLAADIAAGLIACGINVFMPPQAAPVCALSQAIGARNLPIALYLDADEQVANLTLAALSSHGGPFDQQDILTAPFGRSGKSGVAGETDIERAYVNNLAGLADQFIEDGIGFSELVIPFAGLLERLRENPALKILFQEDSGGPKAIVSPDGQSLIIIEKGGRQLQTTEIASFITSYLVEDRLAAGTILGPTGQVHDFARSFAGLETLEVEDSQTDFLQHASFIDLLIGWWHDGLIAHQGSSCFGDAILTAVYYLESCRRRAIS